VELLVARVDQMIYDLIVVAATALFAPLRAHTPVVNGQRAVDAWVSALVFGNFTIGLIYPLSQQGGQLATFDHTTQLRSAHASIRRGYSERLTEAAAGVSAADLIVMHSVGYTESMALQVARETEKPVVTARRIIAAAVQIRLGEIMGRSIGPTVDGYTGIELLKNLADAQTLLTPREQEVMAQALEGKPNKAIGRALNISYRTVELHRARAMAKLGANSITELIRRALT
jgi:protein AroM